MVYGQCLITSAANDNEQSGHFVSRQSFDQQQGLVGLPGAVGLKLGLAGGGGGDWGGGGSGHPEGVAGQPELLQVKEEMGKPKTRKVWDHALLKHPTRTL